MKKLLSLVLALSIFSAASFAVENPITSPAIRSPSAILIERTTGEILYEKNAHERLRPASVTKIMTMLLAMEAIDNGYMTLDTMLTVSEHASSMGGSQVYLKPGEQMSLNEALKCIAVSSANDACVMVGEHISGSEDGFVARMNERAHELGMSDTHFVNCTGLDADGHLTSAYDISLMSRELLKHETIRKYTTIWMDSIRNGTFGLSNTNKLIRFYNGATGLKTGFTSTAGYCVSASAEREGMELIAVIMKSDTSPNRNADASALLNYGFSQYALYTPTILEHEFAPIHVNLGKIGHVNPVITKNMSVLVKKTDINKINTSYNIVESLEAPVEQGQTLGTYSIKLGKNEIASIPILAQNHVERKGFGNIYTELLGSLFMKNTKSEPSK